MSTSKSLYEADYYGWTQETVEALRSGELDRLDIQALAEEVGDLGKSERRALKSHLIVLLAHRLKWDCQPARRTQSWRNTIESERLEIIEVLAESPSLRSSLAETLSRAYEQGRLLAATETGLALNQFPTVCPWIMEALLEPESQPDPEP